MKTAAIEIIYCRNAKGPEGDHPSGPDRSGLHHFEMGDVFVDHPTCSRFWPTLR